MNLKQFSDYNIHEIRSTFAGKVFALTPVSGEDNGNFWTAGIAVANESGYSPVPMSWCHIEMGPDAYETIIQYLDEINLNKLGIPDTQAMHIVASSMKKH